MEVCTECVDSWFQKSETCHSDFNQAVKTQSTIEFLSNWLKILTCIYLWLNLTSTTNSQPCDTVIEITITNGLPFLLKQRAIVTLNFSNQNINAINIVWKDQFEAIYKTEQMK